MRKTMTALALFTMVVGLMASAANAQPDRQTVRTWLEYHAAESLNVMLGQQKTKEQGRSEMLSAFFDAKKLDADFKASGIDKKPHPKNPTFDQLLGAAMRTEVKQGLPPVPSDMSPDALKRSADAAIQLAKTNYDALQPIADANADKMAYLKSKNMTDAYNTWAGQQVKLKKAAYQKWLKTAKAKQEQAQVQTDAAHRKALMAISQQERDQRAEYLQRQMQYVQSQQQYAQERYAIKHYHPVYGYGGGYGDVPYRYRYPNDGGLMGRGGLPQVGSQTMGEANEQLNQAVNKADASEKEARAAEKDYIDADTKQREELLQSQDAMPAGEQLPSEEIRPTSPTEVTRRAAEEAAQLVPDVNRRPQETPEQPAESAEPAAEQPQGPVQ